MKDANGNDACCSIGDTIIAPCLHSPTGLIRDRFKDSRAARRHDANDQVVRLDGPSNVGDCSERTDSGLSEMEAKLWEIADRRFGVFRNDEDEGADPVRKALEESIKRNTERILGRKLDRTLEESVAQNEERIRNQWKGPGR